MTALPPELAGAVTAIEAVDELAAVAVADAGASGTRKGLIESVMRPAI